MPIVRTLIAQDENEENQWLKVDHDTRYIVNSNNDWQFLFGPNSSLSTSTLTVKIAARYNDDTFNNIQIIGYLYDATNASVANVGSCTFNIYRVVPPDWTEEYITTLNGVQIYNNYFYVNPTTASLAPVVFYGGDTIMIEAVMDRLGVIYRDRVYFNHIGIYENVTMLRSDVEFLDITKKDI